MKLANEVAKMKEINEPEKNVQVILGTIDPVSTARNKSGADGAAGSPRGAAARTTASPLSAVWGFPQSQGDIALGDGQERGGL